MYQKRPKFLDHLIGWAQLNFHGSCILSFLARRHDRVKLSYNLAVGISKTHDCLQAKQLMSKENLVREVTEAVIHHAKLYRPLHRGKLELIRDILVLLSGIKPAVVLDYVSVDPGTIVSILRAITYKTGDAAEGIHAFLNLSLDCKIQDFVHQRKFVPQVFPSSALPIFC